MTNRKAEVRQLRESIQNLLNEYGEKEGITISLGNIRYDDSQLSTKLTVINAESKGDADKVLFEKSIAYTDLKPEHYGKTFTNFDGETYTVSGYKPRSRKYPLVATSPNGHQYKFRVNGHILGQLNNG